MNQPTVEQRGEALIQRAARLRTEGRYYEAAAVTRQLRELHHMDEDNRIAHEDARVMGIALRAQKANVIAITALGRIRNDLGMSRQEMVMVADEAVRAMQSVVAES